MFKALLLKNSYFYIMLILLDIDGVMVPAKPWSAPPILEDGFSMFNSKSVIALNEILSKSNADILLTTSHKNRFSIEKWKQLFKSRGINFNKIGRLPENSSSVNRKQEVLNWYSLNQRIKEFVIIDDDTSLNGLPEVLKSRLVSTKPLIGLRFEHVQKALNILNTPLVLAKD